MTDVRPMPEAMRSADGLRQINLATDLGQLADLMELAFADTMDDGGRAALREMRYRGKLGSGVRLLGPLNSLTLGVSQGYVWIAGGRLVGNVSIAPAGWPREAGAAWIIANVGVHPDYQRRGIARQMMLASMDLIRHKGGQVAILQVDADNYGAQGLYRGLGFIEERTWTTWRRAGVLSAPPPRFSSEVYISRRSQQEWQAEYALAQRVRPGALGGLGWLMPLHESYFHEPLWKRVFNSLTLNSFERLVVHAPDDEETICAALWLRQGLGPGGVRLVLMTDHQYQGVYDEALLNTVVRRYPNTTLLIEHPADETHTSTLLSRYHFRPRRSVMHMRCEL